ncbi:MAG: DUF262 domain-containing protein [Actinobacteria bacterium]|nr:DUF262 domain-containing protein [Actinomycetota bacterium]
MSETETTSNKPAIFERRVKKSSRQLGDAYRKPSGQTDTNKKMQPTIAGLIDAVREGDLALPEFQRDYRWPAQYIEELLRSVARGWPIGTLLLLDQSASAKGLKLEARSIEKAPNCKKRPENLILDGQQRVTALYHAMNGLGDSVYYLNLANVLNAGEFLDDALGSATGKQLTRTLGSEDERRRNKIILLKELYSTELFAHWLGFIPKKERNAYAALRDEHLSLFREHTVAIERLPNSLPVEAIAKIFERTNRGFLRLDAFDLMVAIMYPHGFKLRDKWSGAVTANPILKRFEVAPIEILRLIALREHLRQKERRVSPQTVKGVRQSDVLEVKPATVKKEWTSAVAAYVRALTLAESHWGVIRKRIVPAEAQLLPLADALYGGNVRNGSSKHKKLGRWFWAAIFSRQYARAANTRAVSDAEALRAWLKPSGPEPRYVENFKVSTEDFVLVEEGNEILVKGLCCLLVSDGARSWTKAAGGGLPSLLTETEAELAVHHIFPKKFMARKSKGTLRLLPDVDAPANQVLITASLNGKLLNEAPEYSAKNPEVDIGGLKSHRVDPARMKGSQYKAFVNARAAELVPLVDRAVKGY